MDNTIIVVTKNLEPLCKINAERAFCLLWTDRATPFYFSNSKFNEYVTLRSPNKVYYVPKIIILKSQFQLSHWFKSKPMSPTKKLILTRDNHKCVYCDKKATTLDHIIPVSRGGLNTWQNLVSACYNCNNTKGNKTLKEANMILKINPRPITPHDLINRLMNEFLSIVEEDQAYVR